jgi:hypothetical protein
MAMPRVKMAIVAAQAKKEQGEEMNFKFVRVNIKMGIDTGYHREQLTPSMANGMNSEGPSSMGVTSEAERYLKSTEGPRLAWRRRRRLISSLLVFQLAAILWLPGARAFLAPVRPKQRVSQPNLPPFVLSVETTELVTGLQTRKPAFNPVNLSIKQKKPEPEIPVVSRIKEKTVSNRTFVENYFSNPGDTSAPDCRVVSLSDSKLPTRQSVLPESLFQPPHLLRRLDDIYHAMAHDETRKLRYMEKLNTKSNLSDDKFEYDEQEEQELVSVLKTSLEDAGFELLGRRDLELCDALNAGYLLRLSLLPETSQLDPSIASEFYPERMTAGQETEASLEELLFDGRVLVFWRGYSQEISNGRLLLPKIDYLQASLVQRSAAFVKKGLDYVERQVSVRTTLGYRRATSMMMHFLNYVIKQIPSERLVNTLLQKVGVQPSNVTNGVRPMPTSPGKIFKLSRYGGSKIRFVGSPNPTDALTPFVICEETDGSAAPCDDCTTHVDGKKRPESVDLDMYDCLNRGEIMCPYDEKRNATEADLPPMQLLERVTISNLIDVFSKEGRQKLVKTLFSKSELVEPTYEEVVVVWRPLPEKVERKPTFVPPKFVYEVADMFDVEGLPDIPLPKPKPSRQPLEIRAFSGVPMANILAILPKTKLIFRPADAFVFDLISVFSFLVIFGSLKFDNPRLDFLALASVSLWGVRLFFRYSNKLARYDLLVKKFLTSKITHRNAGALKYVATEAGSQRATRAALVHSWLSGLARSSDGTDHNRLQLVQEGRKGVNELIRESKEIPVNIDASLNDLEDLRLVTSERNGQIKVVRDSVELVGKLRSVWSDVFAGEMTIDSLVGRRKRT